MRTTSLGLNPRTRPPTPSTERSRRHAHHQLGLTRQTAPSPIPNGRSPAMRTTSWG